MSDIDGAASDTAACPSSLDSSESADTSQEKVDDSALPVRIPGRSACKAQKEADMHQQIACLRDWQMYSRLSDKGYRLMTPTPDEEMALEAVYAQIAQAEEDDAGISCSAQPDDLVFTLDF